MTKEVSFQWIGGREIHLNRLLLLSCCYCFVIVGIVMTYLGKIVAGCMDRIGAMLGASDAIDTSNCMFCRSHFFEHLLTYCRDCSIE